MSGNFVDYYAACPFPKGKPRQIEKIEKQADLAKQERMCRAAVDRRDKRVCFFPRCRKTATEKHHITSRSVRGKLVWHTDDILSACQLHHSWFKAGLITVSGNPDKGPVTVQRTTLGEAGNVRIPTRRTV